MLKSQIDKSRENSRHNSPHLVSCSTFTRASLYLLQWFLMPLVHSSCPYTLLIVQNGGYYSSKMKFRAFFFVTVVLNRGRSWPLDHKNCFPAPSSSLLHDRVETDLPQPRNITAAFGPKIPLPAVRRTVPLYLTVR